MGNSPSFSYPPTLRLDQIVSNVSDFASLPSAFSFSGQYYYVTATTGIWPFTQKLLGFYKSNGVNWIYTGALSLELSSRSVNTTAPLEGGGDLSIDRTLSIPKATASTDGYLNQTDFTTFNNKQNIYFSQAVANNVTENDVVKNAINQQNGQAPLNFVLASADADAWAIIGVAKNVNNGTADIYIDGRVPGFSFGAFIGVEYYIDPANPGKLTWTPPAIADPIYVGRSLDATTLILRPHLNRQWVGSKGGLYTSDGHWDDILLAGANGNVVTANSAQTFGLQWAPAVVTAAPFTYTTASRTLTAAVATNSVAGVLSAADHTTYSGYAATIALKAPLATPVFTGQVNSSTGDVLISTIGKGLSIKTGLNAKIGTTILIAGVAIVVNTSVTANSRIFITSQTDGGTPGFLRVSSKTAGVGFTITSSSLLDTSIIAYYIIESIP